MQVNHSFAQAVISTVHVYPGLILPPRQSMQTEQIPITSLDDMLFSLVPEQFTELDEIRCLSNFLGKVLFLPLPGLARLR